MNEWPDVELTRDALRELGALIPDSDDGFVTETYVPISRTSPLMLEVAWAEKRVRVSFTLQGDEAEAALDAAGNDLPIFAKKALLQALGLEPD